MRHLNFVIIFIFCLALVLFSIENTEPVIVSIVPGVEIKTALAVELLIAAGFGAMLAWLFSMWTRLLRLLILNQKISQKASQIKELESKVEEYEDQIKSLSQSALPPASDLII